MSCVLRLLQRSFFADRFAARFDPPKIRVNASIQQPARKKNMSQDNAPVWFITGCSTGFGREIAAQVLGRGWRAVVTARNPEQVQDIVAGYEANALGLALDVNHQGAIHRAVQAAEDKFGRIDVLVNNAGYGYLAAIEEGEDDEVRALFETNVFGLIAVTKAVLPGMRARQKGHIVNFSSIGGLVSFPPLATTTPRSTPLKACRNRSRKKWHRSASRC